LDVLPFYEDFPCYFPTKPTAHHPEEKVHPPTKESEAIARHRVALHVPLFIGPWWDWVGELTTYSDCCGSINIFMNAVVASVSTTAIVFW
jgi:hypothetical protein